VEAKKVVGETRWKVVPAITLSPAQIKKVLAWRRTGIVKHSQRGQYYFDITGYPLVKSKDGVVVVVENVTQRSLAENMLIQRDKMASMGELAATMAYDINMPLQGILDDVEIVLSEAKADAPFSQKSLEVLRDAVERGKQASAVVNNLLEFSGQQGSEKQSSQVADIIDHCIELAHNVLSGPTGLKFKDVRVTRDYQEGAPALECYAAELQQVFLSIFRHACHAMSKRSGDADFTAELAIRLYESNGSLWVQIAHNGVSLSVDEQREIFEPFVQQTSPINPKPMVPENRLSFSYFVVNEHHDGELAVTSSPEDGTTFHLQFNLPLDLKQDL